MEKDVRKSKECILFVYEYLYFKKKSFFLIKAIYERKRERKIMRKNESEGAGAGEVVGVVELEDEEAGGGRLEGLARLDLPGEGDRSVYRALEVLHVGQVLIEGAGGCRGGKKMPNGGVNKLN